MNETTIIWDVRQTIHGMEKIYSLEAYREKDYEKMLQAMGEKTA